jgi:hypothetical protein
MNLRKLATMALAMQDPAKAAIGHENYKALPDPHHTGTDAISYDNVIQMHPHLQSVPRRRLRQSSAPIHRAPAPAPAPAPFNETAAPMNAPAPQTMTRVPGLVTKDQQFSIIDGSGQKWTLPPGQYLEGEATSGCCKSTTYAPYKEQIEVDVRDCCGVGINKSTLVLSPGTDNSELPSKCSC